LEFLLALTAGFLAAISGAIIVSIVKLQELIGVAMAYEELFQKIAAEYGLDWHLLVEQAYRESRFDPLAVGKANDMGLMQILPATWDEWAPKVGVFDPFDPESNIRVAAALMAWIREQLTKLGRPEPYWMLAAYNWGIGNVTKLLKTGGTWLQVPKERQDYANDIILTAEANAIASQIGPAARAMHG
jgi:soluble lytic murein transglycosylase-like protein